MVYAKNYGIQAWALCLIAQFVIHTAPVSEAGAGAVCCIELLRRCYRIMFTRQSNASSMPFGYLPPAVAMNA